MARNKLLSKQNLQRAFRAFDTTGRGAISGAELQSMLGKYQDCDDEVWEQIIREVDCNGDGEIDLKEFIAMMTA